MYTSIEIGLRLRLRLRLEQAKMKKANFLGAHTNIGSKRIRILEY